MVLPKVAGIYKIVCKINNTFYIGSAISIRHRWINHRHDLRYNRHCNRYLQNIYNKYGEDSLTIEIIEQCAREVLVEREQYYIDTLTPKLNLARIAGSPGLGRIHTEEFKQYLSEINKDPTLHRCIILDTMDVIYRTQYQIRYDLGIKDFAAFIRKPGHWTKKGIVSFVDKEFNGRRYNDDEAAQFLIDVKAARFNNNSIKRKGKTGTFKGHKHSIESRVKMSVSKGGPGIILSSSEHSVHDPLCV